MKPKKTPKQKPPVPSDLEEFQAAYGSEWEQIKRTPAFMSAMQVLNVRKLNYITALSDAQIEGNGKEILADLRGHLKHENDLFTLNDQKETVFPSEEDLVYVSPEEAEEHQKLAEKFAAQRKREHYGAV